MTDDTVGRHVEKSLADLCRERDRMIAQGATEWEWAEFDKAVDAECDRLLALIGESDG